MSSHEVFGREGCLSHLSILCFAIFLATSALLSVPISLYLFLSLCCVRSLSIPPLIVISIASSLSHSLRPHPHPSRSRSAGPRRRRRIGRFPARRLVGDGAHAAFGGRTGRGAPRDDCQDRAVAAETVRCGGGGENERARATGGKSQGQARVTRGA